MRSRVWALDRAGKLNLGNGVVSPCEPIAELPRADAVGVVPHYLPGQNPFVKEMAEQYNLPAEAVLGGGDTLYPEFRKRLLATSRRWRASGTAGARASAFRASQDGSGVPK